MTTPVESLLTIRKEDFDFLIQHCCTCSCLNSKEKVTVEGIQAAVYPKGWSVQTSKTPQKRKNRQSRVKTADDFMRCVNQWRLTQLMVVTNREKYENMVRDFTLSPTITSEGHNSQRLTAKNLVELGTHLARLVERSINAHMAQKSFTHFQSLIFLSYCLYLAKKGTPSEKIDNLLKFVNKDEKKRKRLLVQAAQINKMIAELGNKGWNIVRATELFLICPFSGYDLLNFSLEDFGDIMSSVSDAKPNFTGCLMPSYTIPGLIERLIQQSGVLEYDSTKVISSYLGYDADTMPATSDCIDQVHDATPLPLDFNNISLVQIVVAKASQVNENGNERPFALLENSEGVLDRLQQDPSNRHMPNIVHEDNSALFNTPRKRRRLEVQIGESSNLQLRPASCNNNLQTIAWEFPLQNSGTTSNVLEIHNQSLMTKPATLHSPQYALPNNISHEMSLSSPLDVSAGLRPEHRGRRHNELMPYTYNAFLPISLEMQNVQRYKNSPQLQIQLHDFRVVPDTARSVWFAITGNIGGLQKLFAQGLASPKDISYTRQYSLVRWALYGGMNNYPTVKFLLSQGASVDEESYQHVWDYAYRMKCNPTELSELKCITMQPPTSYIHTDWVEEQRFPQIHKIVLGRCSESLSVEIDANPNAVNLTDAMNRTALDWATALAKLSDMRILIDRGSPLNTIDVSGRSTVLHAVDSHNEDALSMILEAGADPNPEIPGGLFRSSPLTAATFGGLEGMVKRLLNHGAKVDACNPEGRTALHTVASMQNVECARILLDHGANLGLVNSKGFSPIMTAVVHNSHAVLKLFIDRCNADCLEESQLLPVIAQFADTETMSILATSPLLRETLCKEDLTSSRRSLESRTDYNKVLGNAFDSLCR